MKPTDINARLKVIVLMFVFEVSLFCCYVRIVNVIETKFCVDKRIKCERTFCARLERKNYKRINKIHVPVKKKHEIDIWHNAMRMD